MAAQLTEMTRVLREAANGLTQALESPSFAPLRRAARVIGLLERTEAAFRAAADAIEEMASVAETLSP